MMNNVLIVNTTGFKRNGITTVILDYLTAMKLKKIQVSILVSGDYDNEIISRIGRLPVEIIYAPSRKAHLAGYIVALYTCLKKKKYKTIWVNGNSATMAVELFVAKICGCKNRIAHSHNSTCSAKKSDKLLRPLFYKTYTDAFACGEAAGRWLFQTNRFKVIKNGRDLLAYRYNGEVRKKQRSEFRINDTTLAIGHVGNFNEQKNHMFLIDVFAEIIKRGIDARLFMAGYGHTEELIKNKVQKLGLEKNVIFMGMINNVPDLLQAMDVMALPSLYEGLPLVVIEWQAAGLPCVISDSVTKECVFTDLVHYMSLSSEPYEWAEKIISVGTNSNWKRDHDYISLAKAEGYDIRDSAKKLERYFENL